MCFKASQCVSLVRKGKKGKDGKEKGKGDKNKEGEVAPVEELPRDPIKEAELLLMQR
jgi:hypothetical protein